jgi:hypothetical protein
MFRDARPDVATLNSWKQKVVRHQRDTFLSSLVDGGGWKRVWFNSCTTGARTAQHRPKTADFGYCGRLRKQPTSLREGDPADLAARLNWLKSMSQGERRGGDFDDILLAFLEYVLCLRETEQIASSDLVPVCRLLDSCVLPADDVSLVFFYHDQFLGEIGHRLLEPAVLQLQHLSYSERQPLVRHCLYFLLSVLVRTGQPPRDKNEQKPVASKGSDWLRDSVVFRHLSLAIGHELEPIGNGEKASFRLPPDDSAAALARLLLPPGRLRSRGFILGKSRLNQPVAAFS